MRWLGVVGVLLGLAARASAQLEQPSVNLLTMSSTMMVTSSATLYMTPGSGIDPLESNVAMPLGRKGTFRALACTTSIATGVGKDIAVTGRVGPCGSLVDTGAFGCTIAGGATPGLCTSGTVNLLVSAQQCFSLKVVTPAALPAAVFVNCTLERAT